MSSLGFLAAILGKVNALRTDYTNARAAKLDNLDAAVTTRAAAATALSNATWTNAKAGYLDMPLSGLALTALRDPRLSPYIGTLGNAQACGNSGAAYYLSGDDSTGNDSKYASGSLIADSTMFNYMAPITVADTYVTVADITSGGGWLFSLASPSSVNADGTATHTIRITVDGVAYVLSKTSVAATNKLIWGFFGYYGAGGYWLTPRQILGYGGSTYGVNPPPAWPLRFLDSLKIEAKMSILPSATTYNLNRRAYASILKTGDGLISTGATWS
jgi:hypothetical protein